MPSPQNPYKILLTDVFTVGSAEVWDYYKGGLMKLNLFILCTLPTLLLADLRILDTTRYSKDVIFSTEPTEQEEAKITLVRCLSGTKDAEFNRGCKGRANTYGKPLTMTIDKYAKALQNALSNEKDPLKVEQTIDLILEKALASNVEAPMRRSEALALLALKPFVDLETKHKAEKLLADFMREEQEKLQKEADQKKFEATRPYRCTAEGVLRMQYKRPQEIGRGQDVKGYPRKYKGVSDSGLSKVACSQAAIADCQQQMNTTLSLLRNDYLMRVEFACQVSSTIPK